jgi:hypothetical protein
VLEVCQSSIAQGRTKSIFEVIDCGSNSRAFVLPHVICDTKIIANLKQIRKLMRKSASMNKSTIKAISTIRTIVVLINS